MTKAKELAAATPRPWTVRDDLFGYAIVKGAGGQSVTSLIAPADARLIRDAVNALPAYEAVVEALERIEPLVEHWRAEADAMMDGMYTDLRTNTGVHAARAAALNEMYDQLRPILMEAREALRRLQEQTQ